MRDADGRMVGATFLLMTPEHHAPVARLWAAAPELRDALARLVAALEPRLAPMAAGNDGQLARQLSHQQLVAAWDAGRAALAKANGGELPW